MNFISNFRSDDTTHFLSLQHKNFCPEFSGVCTENTAIVVLLSKFVESFFS